MNKFTELRNSGFLDSEARRISQIPQWETTPWVQVMVKARIAKKNAASRRGVTREEFEQSIIEGYRLKGWLQPGYQGVDKIDVNALIRSYCDKHHDKNPQYTSPWETKARNLNREAKAVRNGYADANIRHAARLEGAYL